MTESNEGSSLDRVTFCFIGMLAFANDPVLQDEVKIGILAGSLVAGLLGWAVLMVAPREIPAPPPPGQDRRTGPAPRAANAPAPEGRGADEQLTKEQLTELNLELNNK